MTPVRPLLYPNSLILFHGTLRDSAESISNDIRFDISAPTSYLGPGFYLTSNLNTAKAYAIRRLKLVREQRAMGRMRGAGPSSASASTDVLTDSDIVTVLVFMLTNAHTITRVYGPPANNGHLTDRSFILNNVNKRGEQYCIHGGCRQDLTLIQAHDIDCRGNVWYTGTDDAVHAPGTSPPFATRGVASATDF